MVAILAAVSSPVLEPDTDTAPAPIVRFDVFATFPVSVTDPVLTVMGVNSVALVTAPAVNPEAVPVQLVSTPDAGIPRAGVVRVGEVRVLFVSVCTVVLSTVIAVSIETVFPVIVIPFPAIGAAPTTNSTQATEVAL